MEVEMVESLLQEVEHQLLGASHCHLVRSSDELLAMLDQIQRSPVPSFTPVCPDFTRCKVFQIINCNC